MQLATEQRLPPIASTTMQSATISSSTPSKTPEELATVVSQFASSVGWMEKVRLRTSGRWFERLHHGPDHDIWLISWLPGQSTGYHDHGASSGAFLVATGVLEEHHVGDDPHSVYPGQPRSFGPDYAHDVRNVSLAPAISIHAYSPPLDEMNEYDLDENQLVPRERSSEDADTLDQEWRVQPQNPVDRLKRLSIEQMLSTARARLQRLSPHQAHHAVASADAILVDIRPDAQRAAEGSIPGALIIERNVLEWRLDPTSGARLPIATHHDLPVIIFCSEGYASSLAAASLQDLGLKRASDIIGGFQAWRAAGLPIAEPAKPS